MAMSVCTVTDMNAATQTVTTTKIITVEASDANGRLSNRQFNACGERGYWRLRDLTADITVPMLTENGFRFRGDRDFTVKIELVIGHEYELSAGDPRGRGKDAPVSGTFTVLPTAE